MFFAKRLYKSMKVNMSSIRYGQCFFLRFKVQDISSPESRANSLLLAECVTACNSVVFLGSWDS